VFYYVKQTPFRVDAWDAARNYNAMTAAALFPLVVSASSGLGVDCSLLREACEGAAIWRAWGLVAAARMAAWDLAAVSRLDVVRTIDLAYLRESCCQ